MSEYTQRSLVKELAHLMRLPTADALSLRAFFDEAQATLRRARAAQVVVPAAIVEWIVSAEERARDPLASARATASLVAALKQLEDGKVLGP